MILENRKLNENIIKSSDPKFEIERTGEALYEAYERYYTN